MTIDATATGVGPRKSWEDAYNDALAVIYNMSRRIDALEAANEQAVSIVERHLKEVTDDQNTVKRMNQFRVGDKSHQKYQPEIDRLAAILHEIKQLSQGKDQS